MVWLLASVRPAALAAALGIAVALAGEVRLAAAEPAGAPSADEYRKLIWKRQFGTGNNDAANAVATDGNGNILISGVIGGRFGGAGFQDAFVVKYSAVGNPLWKRYLGTTEVDWAAGVATDANGNVLICGTTWGLFGEPQQGPGAFVAKYSADGDLLWIRQFGTAYANATGVATDADGSVMIAGTPGLVKYSANGDFLWVRELGIPGDLPGDTVAKAVAADADGNIFVTGTTYDSLDGPNHGYTDAFVAKYSAGGGLRWIRQFGTLGFDTSAGVATDAGGNVVIGGANWSRFFVVKYDSTGALLWSDAPGKGAAPNEGGVVATDTAGNVILSGYTFGAIGGPNKGYTDALIIKYDAAGNRLWKRQIGTTEFEYSEGVATDGEGNIVIGGWTNGALAGPNRGGGLSDAFVAKFRP